MTPVRSSNVEAVGHDDETGRLHVKFKSGGHYSYAGWTEAKHNALLNAPSLGSHLHAHVISKPHAHPHTRHD